MKYQDAIDRITDVQNSDYLFDESIDYQLTSDDFEWLETAKNALELRMPKKPIISIHKYVMRDTGEEGEYKLTHCPHCWEDREIGYFDSLVGKGTKYCHRCGQALDWSDFVKGE